MKLKVTVVDNVDPAIQGEDLRERFRSAQHGVAGCVTIVTAADSIARGAMTMTAVTTVSMDPPSLLVCVNRESSIYSILMRGAGFCVNYLTPRHEPLARLCSDRASIARRFDSPDFELCGSATPILRTAKASVVCAQDGRYLYGTHAIIVGRVASVAKGCSEPSLLYVDGKFRELGS